MTILDRLREWTEQGAISYKQNAHLTRIVREEPFSLFVEWNVLLYAGVLSFAGGLAWTVATWSQQLGDLTVVFVLAIMLALCFWFCFTRVGPWSAAETSASHPLLDYVLYLGCLVWCIELTYLEKRFHLLSGQWDTYLLLTAGLFFLLAYRFDSRFVLSLALSSLAGWFGLTIARWGRLGDAPYRRYALLYCLCVGAGGAILEWCRLKPHFFGTYLNIAANVLFCAVLSGVFERQDAASWFIALLTAASASLAWGLRRRQFSFVAYAAVYGYIGFSSRVIRGINDAGALYTYFLFTGIAMIGVLVAVARRFGRQG